MPDPSLSISQGALVPWTVINSSFYEQVIQAIADRYEIDLETPWQDLPEEQRELFLNGTGGEKLYVSYRNSMGRKRSYMLAFEGILPSLDRRYRDTDSSYQKERIEEYMALKPCPACHGDRLKPTSLAVTVGGINIAELTRMSVASGDRVRRRPRPDRDGAGDRRAHPARDPRAARRSSTTSASATSR